MIKHILFLLLALFISGCCNSDRGTNDLHITSTSINDWNSSNVTIEKRFEFVNSSVQKGTSMSQVRTILGEGVRTCYRWPLNQFDAPGLLISNQPYGEEWVLVYTYPDGRITLHTETGKEAELDNGLYDHASISIKKQKPTIHMQST